MESKFPEDFGKFLSIFEDLEDINLSVNNLNKIPKHMFETNIKLRKKNKFTFKSFDNFII